VIPAVLGTAAAPSWLANRAPSPTPADPAPPPVAAAVLPAAAVPAPPEVPRRLAVVLDRLAALRRRPRVLAVALGVGGLIIVGALAGLYWRGVAGFGASREPVAVAAPVPSDPARRLAYYRDAAAAGDVEGTLQLAILYAKGEGGVTQDYAIAAKWFRAAADKGNARAQYDLGVLYERGRGVPVDFAAAAEWYRKAAQQQYPLAEFNLAVVYTKGQGMRQDLSEAAQWYRRAAGHGVIQAMVNLAVLYERGDGVVTSAASAYAWYLAAGRRGNDAAARRAEELFAVLTRADQVRAQTLAGEVAASIQDPAGPVGAPAGGAEATAKPGLDPAGAKPADGR
jgi:hypothetical protein